MSYVGAFSGLNTALKGVLAQQRALDTTGHNIANVETQGYSRQEAVLTAARALQLNNGQVYSGASAQIGQGVEVAEYRRLRNDFLDLQWRAQNMNGGEADARASKLMQVEAAINDSSESGLSKQLSAFYNAWSDLAANPESPAARTALYGKAQTLMAGIHSLDQTLANVDAQATNEVATLLSAGGKIEQIARELNTLNEAINRSLIVNDSPNDLMDRRDLLLDQLSAYGKVSTSVPNPAKPGYVTVIFAGAATPLVDNSSATPVTVPTPGSLSSPGGRLEGLQGASTAITSYRASLDALANHLVTQVNAEHTTPAFFLAGGTTAATIAFGVGLTGPADIVAGSGASGDNSIALAIAAQRSSSGTNPTTDWTSLLAQVGSDLADQKASSLTAQRVLDSLTAQRTSTQGVSLDEEMTNMMRFQRGYQAAARSLTAMDENLDILINRTGRVGL
jgi:flagellar hook-associated protein 1 FlgK